MLIVFISSNLNWRVLKEKIHFYWYFLNHDILFMIFFSIYIFDKFLIFYKHWKVHLFFAVRSSHLLNQPNSFFNFYSKSWSQRRFGNYVEGIWIVFESYLIVSELYLSRILFKKNVICLNHKSVFLRSWI